MNVGRFKHHFGCGIFVLTAIAIALRLPVGLDLSDESYYAIFLDDWLKGGIASSTLLTVHQTAALLIYPFARLYVVVTGSSDGLFVVLRFIYFIGSAVSAAIWVHFLLRLGCGSLSYWAGAAILAFIPFGLPAPSYNTIGQQSSMIALAAVGLASLHADAAIRRYWQAVSVLAASVASVAYPPLSLPVGIMLLLGLVRPVLPKPSGFAAATIGGMTIAWAIIAWVLTPQRLWSSITYLSEINDQAGLSKKIAFATDVFGANPAFMTIGLAALALGIVRPRLPTAVAALGMAVLLLLTFAVPTVMFSKSHDAVTLAMLFGVSFLRGLRNEASHHDRIIAVIYATALTAAATTMITATFSIYNICIGGLPAAVLALAAPSPRPRPRFEAMTVAPVLAIFPSLLATSLLVPYGEIPSQEPRRWVRDGFFKGILAKERDIAPLLFVLEYVEPSFGADRTLAVFARIPGLALSSKARVKMLTVFPLMPSVHNKLPRANQVFYDIIGNRPELVVIYTDPYFALVNPMGASFPKWYVEVLRTPMPLGEIRLYQRR